MRTLSVIPEHIAGLALTASRVDIYGQSFFIGLLEVEEPEFDAKASTLLLKEMKQCMTCLKQCY